VEPGLAKTGTDLILPVGLAASTILLGVLAFLGLTLQRRQQS
jgi:hypothetical protein